MIHVMGIFDHKDHPVLVLKMRLNHFYFFFWWWSYYQISLWTCDTWEIIGL